MRPGNLLHYCFPHIVFEIYHFHLTVDRNEVAGNDFHIRGST